MKKILIGAIAASLATTSAFEAFASPLLMENKESIYERVLTTPKCVLKSSPAAKTGKSVPAFSRYYVYEHAGKMLKVGPDLSDKIAGYVDEACTVPWKAQTALMFTNSAGRDRAIIFKDKDTLQKIADADDNGASASALLKEAVAKGKAPGVVALEPENFVDYKKQFYLLPITDFEEVMLSDGAYARELEIASVSSDKQKSSSDPATIKAFKAAVVFVIDSSISMQPYIDRTKEAVAAVYKQLEKEHMQKSVQFGLVSFRSNTKAVPGLQYTSKLYVKPGDVSSSKEFAEKVRDLSQAKVSSALFDEDSYAGINTALSQIDWSPFGGRYVVLITDAGAISGTNKLSTTGLDSKELRLEAQHHGAAVYALHLLTPSGKRNANHDKARTQYEDLTYNSVVQKSLYYPVEAGDVDAFGKMVDSLSQSIAEQVKMASEGKLSAGSVTSDKGDALKQDTALLGHAMALSYMGSVSGTKAPDFFKGWILDRDLVTHNRSTATPVVLLTKNELSDLKEVTGRILDAANRGMLSPDDMFDKLRSAAAALGRDPSSLKSDKSLKLSQMGILGEYLDDLPYKSRIQELDEESWSAMGADEQNRLIEDLEQKLNFYQKCNDDLDRWVKLSEDAEASQSVYPIPLEALP